MTTLIVERRFRGPPESGNGGYVAGLLARELGGSDCEVTLLKPPPLDCPLTVKRDGTGVLLMDGEQAIASAAPATVDLEAPPPPSLAEAEAARGRFAGFNDHVFPGCFVCGPERGEGDGLRIFPGSIGSGRVAAAWLPSPELCGDDGTIRTEFLWAGLDCAGYFAVEPSSGPAVLGRFAVRIDDTPVCGKPLVVAGWHLGSSGRKHRAGTALYSDGRPVAVALATWISLRQVPA